MLNRIRALVLACAIVAISGASSHASPPREPVTAITNVTLIDGTESAPRRGVTVLVRDRRIADIFATGTKPLLANAAILDGTGKFLIPGLIDAHVHLGTQPDRPIAMSEAILANAFMGGVTTVRDMGGQMSLVRRFASRAAADTMPWPRVYYSAIMAGPGMWFDGPRGVFMAEGGPIGSSPLVRLVSDTTNVAAVIAAAKRAGATGIKLYNTIPLPLVRDLAREAHRNHLRVWSHLAVDPVRPSDLVEADADVVSHADQFIAEVVPYPPVGTPTEQVHEARRRAFERASSTMPAMQRVLATMRRTGTMLDATLYIMTPQPDSTGHVTPYSASLYRFATSMVRAARDADVPIVAGTDALGGNSPNLHVELQLLVDSAGLTPSQALRAATANGAAAIDVSDSLGTIAVGKLADLVLLNADPLADIANTQAIVGVMKAGHWHPRSTPMRLSPRARPPMSR